METQEDSVDIAHLKRLALGLVEEESQLQLRSRQGLVHGGTDSASERRRQAQQRENVTGEFSADSYVGDRGNTIKPLILAGNKFPHLPPPQRRNRKMGSRQRASQPEPSDTVPETYTRGMTPEDTAPGDTQPVSPSVFESMINKSKSFLGSTDTQLEPYDNAGDGVTQLTLIEGDTGHIDLLDGLGELQDGDNSENDVGFGSNIGDSSPARFQPNQFPESQRFISKTPATDKRRRRRDPTTAETPSLPINPLARDGGGQSGGQTLALSQAFKATQAPSSPFVNGLTSDFPSDRPSPNIPIESRPAAASLSSPFPGPSPALRRGITEPQTNYVSMKESQAVRQKLAEQRKTRSASHLDNNNQSEDEFEEDSLIKRRVRQKMDHEETREQLTKVTAPARPTSKGKGKKSDISIRSHNDDIRHGRDQEDTVIVSDDNAEDDLPATDNGASSEEETEQEEDLDRPINQRTKKPTSSSEEDKENFDDPLTNGLDSTSRAHGALSQVLELDASPSVRRNIFADTLPISSQKSRTGDENLQPAQRNSQDINVADSQPNREDSPTGKSSTIPSYLQTSSIAPQYFPPKSQITRPRNGFEKSSSPVIKSPIPSSPPMDGGEKSREQEVPNSRPVNDADVLVPQSDAINPISSNEKSTDPSTVNGQGQAALDDSGISTQQQTKPQEHSTQVDSSLSRVYETPIHNKPLLQSFLNTVPETSPASQRDNARIASATEFSSQKVSSTAPVLDTDNDMLPPRYTEGRHLHATSLQRATAAKRLSKSATILSSPSGRLRRTLTQIASDPPPEDQFGDVDVDVGLVTKDDNEFRSIVGSSPNRPKKRRRLNDGKDMVTTRMVPIKPPGESSPAVPIGKPADAPTPDDHGIEEVPVLRRSRPSHGSENVWDIETSPQKKPVRARSLSRSRSSSSLPLRRSRLSEPNKRPNGASVAQEGAIVTPKGRQTTSTNKSRSLPRDSPDPIQADTPMTDPGTEQDAHYTTVPSNNVVAPNQVFGCFNGRKRAYYPATCLGTATSIGKNGYVIRFDDTDADEVDSNGVKRLELRIGDIVKVDMPDFPKLPHIVRGFQDRIDPMSAFGYHPDSESPAQMTDIYGYSTVLVGPKQRKSLPNTMRTKLVAVPISKIYFDTVLWAQLKDRKFTYTPEATSTSFSRLGTPCTRHGTPVSQISRVNQTPLPTVGLFAGMVFAISYRGKEEVRSRVASLITRNGGYILENGFEELFTFPTSVPTATPKKAKPRNPFESPFQLNPSAENIGFAALIADQHSRRAKYMQALALNIPCLSGRWIEDCIERDEILQWEHYLLPAGESKLLHGAIRSRVLAPNPATTARFMDTTAARPKLLEGQSVLLVMGRGKAEEKRKAYVFLTYALGADRVERVLDLKAAKTALSQAGREERASQGDYSPGSQPRNGWDWVYVDDQEESTAREMLPGVFNPKAARRRAASVSRKRKRSERAESVASTYSTYSSYGGSSDHIRVVGNEFVCQSLILGKLFEE
ncbi:hypothetical protein FQN54_005384 [Arachnomyces sp. PD_36]|nr:hypothetical protein FQN54_005384 [Arachnomyces sp. PD_36]